jgi:serine/threonine-protein kinase
VAVLPFVNTGGVAADDHFSDGLTDELAHALGRLSGLRVAGRTSSYAFKGKSVGAREIGRALGVDALVGGTVRRAGGRLRVTAQLVNTADGAVVWDSVYESRSRDVFAVQDEVTRAVVAAMTPALGDRSAASVPSATPGGRGTTDAEAYELYLKGRYYYLERGAANVARSIAYFRQAAARDPSFARAHAGLAIAYEVLSVYVADPTDSATALVAASAERAVALDSMLADAQLALAYAFKRQLRLRDAEARYRAALALEPSNVSAHQALGLMLLSLGRTDDALVEAGRAAQFDPLAKSASTAYTLALVFARRYPEAVAASQRTLLLDPTFSLAFWIRGVAQTFAGQPDSAVLTLERGMQVHPETPGNYSALVLAYAAAGRWADAERVRTQLRRPGGDPSGGAVAAFAELVFGDREPLVRLLSTAAGQRRWIDAEGALGCHPLLDPLWSDARFRAAMRRSSVEECKSARPWPFSLRTRS